MGLLPTLHLFLVSGLFCQHSEAFIEARASSAMYILQATASRKRKMESVSQSPGRRSVVAVWTWDIVRRQREERSGGRGRDHEGHDDVFVGRNNNIDTCRISTLVVRPSRQYAIQIHDQFKPCYVP